MDFSALLDSFAAAFSQHQRLLTLQLDGGQIAAEQLLPHTLDGSEGVSEAYRYQLSCLSPDGNLELKSLLGVAARLGVLDAAGSERVRFHRSDATEKVQFHWQRADEHPSIGAKLDDTSSCWLRVAISVGIGFLIDSDDKKEELLTAHLRSLDHPGNI